MPAVEFQVNIPLHGKGQTYQQYLIDNPHSTLAHWTDAKGKDCRSDADGGRNCLNQGRWPANIVPPYAFSCKTQCALPPATLENPITHLKGCPLAGAQSWWITDAQGKPPAYDWARGNYACGYDVATLCSLKPTEIDQMEQWVDANKTTTNQAAFKEVLGIWCSDKSNKRYEDYDAICSGKPPPTPPGPPSPASRRDLVILMIVAGVVLLIGLAAFWFF